MDLGAVEPLCRRAGLDATVDASDADMAFELAELPQPQSDTAENCGRGAPEGNTRGPQPDGGSQRNRVHVGSKEFEHLRGLDMNKLCARVVVHGVKSPAAE